MYLVVAQTRLHKYLKYLLKMLEVDGDLSGPLLHVVIKMVSMLALLIAPLLIK